jgi:hypothetical protein
LQQGRQQRTLSHNQDQALGRNRALEMAMKHLALYELGHAAQRLTHNCDGSLAPDIDARAVFSARGIDLARG